MPGYIQRLPLEGPPQFETWVFPRRLGHTSLIDPANAYGKLVVLFCPRNNLFTDIYTVGMEAESLQDHSLDLTQLGLLKAMKAGAHHRRVKLGRPEIVQVGHELTGIDAIKVSHNPYVSLDQMPLQYR